MKFLTSEIDSINVKILEYVSGISKYYGLARQMTLDGEKTNIEIKSNKRVFLDSDADCLFYHKLMDVSFEEIRAGGKKKLYNAVLSIDLVGMSKSEKLDSQILAALSNFNLVSIKKINYDSMTIASAEANTTSFDFSGSLFVISYQIPIKTDNCFEICQ